MVWTCPATTDNNHLEGGKKEGSRGGRKRGGPRRMWADQLTLYMQALNLTGDMTFDRLLGVEVLGWLNSGASWSPMG